MNSKIIFILTLVLTSFTLVQAQVTPAQAAPTQPSQPSTNYTNTNPGQGYSPLDISSNPLPDPLQQTLQSNNQFKGWETGQWYYNSSTNQYSVQMPALNTGGATTPTSTSVPPTNPTTTSPPTITSTPSSNLPTSTTVWYRFDETGKLIPQKPNN